MSVFYEYKGLIPQNIAPKGAKKIIINHNGKIINNIALGKLSRTTDNKLYSYGVISDTHVMNNGGNTSPYSSLKLDNALTWFENQGCLFVTHTGDITNHGFWNSDETKDLTQFAEYKRVCEKHSIPIYTICGNHDSYFKPITDNVGDLLTYTNNDVYYSITEGNDMFIFLGQPSANIPMSDEAFSWLKNIFLSNKEKRFFVHVHCYLDSGNAHNSYGNNFFATWNKTSEFKKLLSEYKTVLFHGHSHINFIHQETDKTANYTNNGFHSVHVPSLIGYRQIAEDEPNVESLGYLVDVYSDYIVLNGRDFGTYSSSKMINPKYVPIATYRINI